jgi:peptidoglycan/xylan/chitin deacetylase (PgdA/CDA1 family)
MYHNVSDKGSTPYVLRVTDFRAQMQYLSEAGYETVTVSELASVIRNGGYLPPKPVVITFDDGFLGVYQNALPVLEEYGFRGVVYLISGTVGTDLSYGYLQEEEILALAERGWEIGSHSISHSNLKTTSLGLRNEVEGSREYLEERLDLPIRSFAYPYNVANAWIRQRVEEYGYDSAVGVDIFNSHPPERLFFLSRRAVLRGTSAREFRALLESEGD